MDTIPTTTWGDCPNRDCDFYGKLIYGILPGDYCGQKREDAGLDTDDYCYSDLRWWDRWHDGEHGFMRDGCTYGQADMRLVATDDDRFTVECPKHGTVTTQDTIADAELSAYIHLKQDPDMHPGYVIVGPTGRILFPRKGV